MEEALEAYIGRITEIIKRGDAREETFYPALETLVKELAGELGQKKPDVTTLPKKTEAGNPDFRVWDGSHNIVGYIEAKQPGENLSKIAESEQLQRYRNTFPNVILTDFFEFRLYKDGEIADMVSIGRPFVAKKLGEKPPLENVDAFLDLLNQFFSHSVPRTLRASSLAKELAKRTRFLEHVIERELVEEENKRLNGFYEAFRQHLIAGLKKEEFADLYSQTVTYGLFAARTRADDTFTRRNAVEFIPSTIGILKDVFEFISYGQLPENIRWIVDDIAEILNAADINQILDRYYDEGKGKDPIIHFYETFLAEYNPDLREQRGVYYTPEPVVKYIVRSVHHILKEDFDKPLGLADSSVTVLDPSAGTLTFIAEAFRKAVNEYAVKFGQGGKKDLIKDHLLEHFYAFELMMAPYAIGHLKMGFILDELGYTLSDDERFKLYLTNTLDMEDLEQTELPGMASLSEESKAAGKIKKEEPVLVILGNPPYSGNSFNTGGWIDDLLKEGYSTNGHKDDGYYSVDGQPLDEWNPKMLQDDYVKFIRFAQWKIDQNGQGIVSMITNHGYLENPTFRGMRQSLMRSFDEICVVDLHGNYRKKETAPDGTKDENVFDIQQGVAIHTMVKKQGMKKKIQRADIYGKRVDKYEWLEECNKRRTDWVKIDPQTPFYFFKKLDYELGETFKKYIKLNAIFPVHSTGIKTHRDNFVIDFDDSILKRRISNFLDERKKDDEVRLYFDLKDNRDWKLSEKRKALQNDKNWKDHFTEVLYRPFDLRHIFYHQDAIDFGREEVMKHMLSGKNLALISPKQFKEEPGALVTDLLAIHKTVSAFDTNYYFPLYLYSKAEKENAKKRKKGGGTMMMVFEEGEEYADRRPNINKEFYALLENVYRQKHSFDDSESSDESEGRSQTGERIPTPEQILYYTYAVLYAPAYRQTYAEFLKSDFPRVPFTKDYELFCDLAEFGEELTNLHLMKSEKLNDPIAKFQGEGNNVIAKSKKVGRNYVADEERVYINKEKQYFEGIPEEVWEYQIGGYQVLDKWLYDRRERHLSNEEIQHYCRVATALYHTIELQKEIDELYAGVEEDVVEWKQ